VSDRHSPLGNHIKHLGAWGQLSSHSTG
jgi:hypothetical protein